MRVLVTGAAGFVGSHVVQAFTDAGCEVAQFDAKLSTVRRLDHMDRTDVVISLAATANPREALRDPVKAYRNGVTVMVDTLEFARKVGARVLHVSSNEVYGHKVGFPYQPRGPYAGAKACQEIVCRAFDWPVTVVVTQSLFGERQQPDKLVPTAIRRLLAGEPIKLQRSGVHWASRPFMHVRNLADALLHLAEGEPWDLPDRVHVGADQSLTVLGLVGILADAVGREPLIVPAEVGGRAGHELTAERIGCDLDGWQPTYETVPALKDTAAWYMDNPEWLEPPDALADSHPAYSSPPREARRAA